jgi:type II secretory pathway pseudopilin PulG
MTELLVVVAVILILMVAVIFSGNAMYANAMRLKCQHRLEQIGMACQMYASAHHGMMPPSWNPHTGRLWYETLANGYLTNWNAIACPSVGDPPAGSGQAGWDTEQRENTDVLLGALVWLKEKQETSGTYKGRWTHKTDGTTTQYYQGITGLALLAYLGFGCTDKHPPEFTETVRLAVEYLASDTAQIKSGTDAGKFRNNTSKTMYAQSICTMALAGASRTMVDTALRDKARAAAQLGLNWIVANQPDHGAFGYYGDPGDGNSDTSVCGWAYQAVAACSFAGIHIPQTARDRAEEYLSCVHDSYGRSTYWWTPPNGGGAWLAERETPIALTTRLLLGHGPDASDSQLQANWLMSGDRIINYHEGRNGNDLYGLYYTSLSMNRMGGTYWSKWFAFYPDQVLIKMIQDSPEMCHWPSEACGSSAQVGGGTTVGEVYATAMAALTLEAAFEEHWLHESWKPTGGECSYGYNNRLGKDRRTPDANTILVMDYEHWQIDHDDIDVEHNDDIGQVAARHSDRANALMGDYRVETLPPAEISDGMWTLTPAD